MDLIYLMPICKVPEDKSSLSVNVFVCVFMCELFCLQYHREVFLKTL